MSEQHPIDASDQARAALDRRGFLKAAGAGVGAAGVVLTNSGAAAQAQQWSEKDKLLRIASCSYPIRYIFKTRPNQGRGGGSGTAAAASSAAAPSSTAAPAAAAPAQQAGASRPANGGWTSAQMKEKYGEITMLDFPQFTKDTFPGVTHMDIFSGLFGDVTDDSMFAGRQFDPSTPSGKKWLDELADEDGGDRRQVPAHLEQRADEPRRP